MSTVMGTRVAAALGLLSVIVSYVGLSIHGYPAIGASGKEIVHWATTTNQRQFVIGIYIEAIGTLLFLPFAAWLCTIARRAEDGWLATAGLGAVALYVGISIFNNGIWSSLLDGARHGTSPQTLASIRDIAEYVFRDSYLFGGMFFVLTGYVLFRTIPRWISGTAVALGLAMLVPPLALVTGPLVWAWTVVASLYLLVRPRAVATVREPSGAVVGQAGSAAAGTPS